MSLSVPLGGPVFWYLMAFAAATIVCLGAAWRAWYIPYAGTRKSLGVFFLSSAGWAAAYIGFLLSASSLAKHFFYQASLIVGFGTVWAWLWFCSAYTGRALHRNASARWFAIIVYGGVTLLKMTNPFHHLYYTLEPSQGAFGFVVRHGLLYWVVMGGAYALATAGYLMLFEMFWKTETRTGPLAALTALTAAPAVLNIMGHINPAIQEITHEPLGVAVFAIGVLLVYSYQFQAVRLAGSLSAPTIMLSADGRIKDYGRRIIELFPKMEDRSAIGEPLGAALPELAQKLEQDRPLLKTTDGAAPRYYRIVETSLGATGGSDVVVFSDITERERRERALRDRQEKVEALYATISQLLRAQDREEAGRVVLRLVNEVFGYPLVSIRFADDGQLVPVQDSPQISEHMPAQRPPVDVDGDSLLAEVYRDGEPLVVDDLHAVDTELDYGAARAAVCFPMGSHGTIAAADLEEEGIDPFEHRLLDVLAAHAAVVLDRLDQEETLRTAKEVAEEASQMKSALLANTSHEFRTPLTSIIGFAEEISTMAEDDASPIGRFADHIESSGHRLLDTLDALLNLSRLQGGDLVRSPEPTDMITVVEEATDQFYPEAAEKDITLRMEANGAPVWTRADREGLRIALQNLISNAVKYTEAGGSVWIRTRAGEETAVLEVEDTGVGMDPGQTDALFEPFRQESEGMGRKYEGTGLGLAVTKEAVEQMGGTIEVQTEKGEGSCFTVRLPGANAPETVGA
ncbi:ATP-binding protein [Salinibacter altiplanensis]|uniref:sensor histidine kinase n=1 Tax=Salinibacter altiplanensis TaxID=1803181 RepID=UPI000C9F7841|nr:ATP-binding protein [Salinibacter altiplanensis]